MNFFFTKNRSPFWLIFLLCVFTSFRFLPAPLHLDMKPLSFMLGKWEGKGQYLIDNQLFKVKRTLHIMPEKGGRQIRITSLAIEDEPLNIQNRIVQQQQHVLTFNSKTQNYTIKTHINNQLFGQTVLEVPFEGFCTWKSQNLAGHRVRFHIRYEQGKWMEVGEILKPKQGWVVIAASELEQK